MTFPDISKLVAVVKAAALAYAPGTAEAIAVAEAVIDLVKSVRPILSEPDAAELDAALPGLLVKMNLDVDQALADLRGG